MNGADLIRAMHDGSRVYGTMIVSPAPEWPAAVSQCGLDFVFIDTEHIALDRAVLSWMCRAYSAMGLSPLVRIPSPDPYQASMVLDGGAEGLIAPYVETPEEVVRLRGAVKFKPLKGKRLQEALYGESVLEPQLGGFLEREAADRALIVNIESVPALEALDDILAVPGLDAVLVGPHDLSINLGIPLEYRNPKFVSAVDRVFEKARAAGIGAGLHAMYPDVVDQEIRWARMGANVILHQADILAFRLAMQRDIRRIQEELGELSRSQSAPAAPYS
jgi:2-keto-3-deoxy-L-rhamnonate aldolase RhmA